MTLKEKLIHTAFFGLALILYTASAARTEGYANPKLLMETNDIAKHTDGETVTRT